MKSERGLAKPSECRHRLKRRWAALVAAGVLAGGCGTRLTDAEIRAGVFETQPESATSAPAGALPTGQPGETVGLPIAGAGGSIPGPGANSAAAPAGAPGSRNVTGQVSRNNGSGASSSTGGGGVASSSAGGPAPGGATPAPAASRVTIGHIGDYSGVVGAILGPGALGMQVAVRHINDHGGLNGHPVQLVVGDAAGDPARALSLARDMVENRGAVAFVGNIWPLSASGPKSYLEQKHIAVLGGDGASGVWFESPVYFPNGPGHAITSVAAAKTSVNAGKRKIAVLHCVEADPCAIWSRSINARAASVGAQVVYDAQVSLAQPDYTAECLQAQRNGAEGIMAGVDGGSLSRIARSCKQQGYLPLYVTLNLATVPATAKDPNLDGLLTPTAHFPYVADDTPAAREYHEAMARYAPAAEGPATGATWAAGALLREVAKALPANPTPEDFFQGVWRIKGNNLGGLTVPLTYVKGQATTSSECYFLVGVKDRRYVAPQGSKPDCL